MIIDLHNHTKLCNHAKGDEEEYIQRAIALGSAFFGFSDHAPMDFDPKYRMQFSQMSLYENKILQLQQKYKDKIEILLGYEVDYLKNHIDQRVLDAKVDYLIGSVHFLNKWGFDNPEFIKEYELKNIDEIWEQYFATITEMVKSNLFNIVGHLDLIKIFKFMPTKNVVDIAKDTLLAIKNSNMVLEINTAGYRKPIGEPYPSYELIKEAYKLGIPITFGSDAHEPTQVGLFSDEIVKMAKDIGYKECAYFKQKNINFVSF